MDHVKVLEAAASATSRAVAMEAILKQLAEVRRSHANDVKALRQRHSAEMDNVSSEIAELRRGKAKVESELRDARKAACEDAATMIELQKKADAVEATMIKLQNKADAVEAEMKEQLLRCAEEMRKMTLEHHKSMADTTAAFTEAFVAQASAATAVAAEKELLLEDAAATIEYLKKQLVN